MPSTKRVWVFIENYNGRLLDGSLELVNEGRRIAGNMNEELTVVLLGSITEEQIKLLGKYGTELILIIEYPRLSQQSIEIDTEVLSNAIIEHSPDVVLFLHSIYGADLASRVAAKLNTGLVTGCDRVDVNSQRLLTQTKPVYGGKASATFLAVAESFNSASMDREPICILIFMMNNLQNLRMDSPRP